VGGVDKVVVVWGVVFANMSWKMGLGLKNIETEHNSLVLNVPCEMTVEGDGGR
jgi:hypothetical protein